MASLVIVYEYLRFLVTDPVDLCGRDRNFLARKPMAGLDDQVTNCPTLSSMIKSVT